jgi:hypothetical protein
MSACRTARRSVRGYALVTLFQGPAYKGGRDGSSCSFECVLCRSGARCAMKDYDELITRPCEIEMCVPRLNGESRLSLSLSV